MEQFKRLDELTKIDVKHEDWARVTGQMLNLELLHKTLSKEILNKVVPDEIKGQFNVAKNMALYSYFFYALAPEVHLKSAVVTEYALRLRTKSKRRMTYKQLINHAVSQRWISDAGFRHINNPKPDNSWCKAMIEIAPSLRNSKAHGTTFLVNSCTREISICADFINQLFPDNQ
ncbi:FIG00535739: hypothetical protein [hydrothermal vent metagenome]|uniref:Uncharacterized protein n=1 Tax=hydrothermal vent metagenome TaxID=652676 RepID=A0A1W1E4W5_9ZZZZ